MIVSHWIDPPNFDNIRLFLEVISVDNKNECGLIKGGELEPLFFYLIANSSKGKKSFRNPISQKENPKLK